VDISFAGSDSRRYNSPVYLNASGRSKHGGSKTHVLRQHDVQSCDDSDSSPLTAGREASFDNGCKGKSPEIAKCIWLALSW